MADGLGQPCVCVYEYADHGPEFSCTTFPVAAKEHECCECGEVISKGTKHEVVKGKWDGYFSQHRTCMACKNVRDNMMSCGWVYGELWHDIRQAFEDEYGADDEDDDYEWLR